MVEARRERDLFADKLKSLASDYQSLSELKGLDSDQPLLRKALSAIKGAIVTTFRYVDFYKDLQTFVAQKMFES